MTPTITAFERSPDRGRGLARDMRVRWALEEVGQDYDVRLLSFEAMKQPGHLAIQPFGQHRDAGGDIDQPRGVLRAFHVPRYPVEIVGGSAQHAQLSNTQVSLVPPPCDEFTTSEPSRSATRVRPPGIAWMRLPDST